MTGVTEYTSAAVSDRGLSPNRPHNEDSYLELPQFGLFAVADGVGGAQAGEVASQMAVEILSEAFINRPRDADPEDTMRLALDRANEAIYQMSHDLPQLSSMATTIAAIHIAGDIATIAHVGDSRVYRVDQTGKLFRETDDHSVVEEEVRAGRMTPQQALYHPSRNVISRALGAEDTVDAEIKCVLVHPATTFLLCSDGITRHIEDTEIESLLSFGGEPAEICARMKEICFSRGAEDNLTAVIVHFPGERVPAFAVQDDDIEEVTLAGARPVPAETAGVDGNGAAGQPAATADAIKVAEEAPVDENEAVETRSENENKGDTEPASAKTEFDDESYLIPEPEEQVTEKPAESPPFSATRPIIQASPQPSRAPGSFLTSYEEPAAPSAGTSGKLITFAALLLLGMLIGGIGTYYFAPTYQPVVQAPAITEQKSNNVPLTSFEETRRLVDADPVRYLNAKAATPQEADDFFWLGRALLLTGKPVEAKRAFEEARRRLPTVAEPSNIRTMSNEIAMGITIADNQQASDAFTRELSVPAAATSPDANSNLSLPNR